MAARVAPFSSPFLKRAELARSIAMSTPLIDVLVPVALDQTYSYRVPASLELSVGDLVSVPLGARGETIGVVWAEDPDPKPRLHNRMKDVGGQARRSAAQAGAAQVRRLGVRLHAEPARHGAAHVPAHGRASRAGARTVGVRLVGPRRSA